MFDYHFSKQLAERLLTFTSKGFQQNKGTHLLTQGQPLTKLILIESGTISLSYNVANGRRLLLGQLDCNFTLIGEIEALNAKPCIYTVTCQSDVYYHLIDFKDWQNLLLKQPELCLYTAQTFAAKFMENHQINLDKLLLPLSYNIAKDCLSRYKKINPIIIRPYSTVNEEAERFATTERAYRRVVSELVELGIIKRTDKGLKPENEIKLIEFIEQFNQK